MTPHPHAAAIDALNSLRVDTPENFVRKHYDTIRTALTPTVIQEGGVSDYVSIEDAIKYWNQDIKMEMRDPCGMAANSKCALALLKEIASLRTALANAPQVVTEEEFKSMYGNKTWAESTYHHITKTGLKITAAPSVKIGGE